MKSKTCFPDRNPRAFTLIELLTVIAIIGILAAILIPTVGKVRQSGSKAQMSSNLRQIGMAMNAFAADNRDSLPGLYVNGTDAGGLNASYDLGSGQSAYGNPALRTSLQSRDQIGRYISTATVTVDGVSRQYCSILESPAFASKRSPGTFPPSILLGKTVMGDKGALIYPFGLRSGGLRSMRISQLHTNIPSSRRWLAIEIDKTTPTTVDPTIKSAGWYNELPDQPVHGSGWLAVFFDGHVEMIKTDDVRLNNRAAL